MKMGGVIRHIIISGIAILCVCAPAALCGQPPTGKDIQRQATDSGSIFGEFMRSSLTLRLRYQYSDGFPSQKDPTELADLARTAGAKLSDVHESQSAIKEQIANYEGSNWDALYGKTELWRKLCADLQRTAVLQCRVDLYRAVGSEQAERKKILQEIIEKCESPKSGLGPANTALLKARAFEIMGRTDDAYKPKAREILRSLNAPDKIGDYAFCQARVLDMQITGAESHDQLRALADLIRTRNCGNDFEFNVALALMEIKLPGLGDRQMLRAAIARWPALRIVLGEFILARLADLNAQGRLNTESLSKISDLFRVESIVKYIEGKVTAA